MKLGYVHTDREEQNKVMKVLKMISEPVALDELGIGRIRDAFADKMFPGISTLQKRMKYFALLPQLYNIAAREQYSFPDEVRPVVRKLEIAMTKKLIDGNAEHTGITGINAYNRDKKTFNDNKFVKYDPAYIYNSGLLKYDILKDRRYDVAIFNFSKRTDEGGLPCEQPDVVELDLDNETPLGLELTKSDADFIIRQIKKTCSGSLLYKLIECATEDDSFELPKNFEDVSKDGLPCDLQQLLDCAQRFANFIYIVHVRYNYVYSRESNPSVPDKELEDEFIKLYEKYKKDCSDIKKDINDILSVVHSEIREPKCIEFCEAVATLFATDELNTNALDELIKNREKSVKPGRYKIGNKPYSEDRRVHYHKLTYRWEVVRKFVEELRKGVKNGGKVK
ncbi:MAG: hypothetical protein J6Q73_05145 [Bacteroidaceae bacterium]|nr:hypothetical protein [Bacteroidaceae bacterium]